MSILLIHSAAPDVMDPYPSLIGKFYFHYSMLVLNSFGLQNAMERSAVDIGHFFARCHSAASSCALITRDHLGPRGFLKYSPDSHFVMISYALLSLLKVFTFTEIKSSDLTPYLSSLLGQSFRHSSTTNTKYLIWSRMSPKP